MPRRTADSGSSWGKQLISVSDLMAGLLFVFILLVVAFAFELNRATEELTNATENREQILDRIEQSMRERGVPVRVDKEHGVLRLPEEILFPSGSATITDSGSVALMQLADVLCDVLPEYTLAHETSLGKPNAVPRQDLEVEAKLEAILIEGHTDSVRVGPSCPFASNWELSTGRALSAYVELMRWRPELDSLANRRMEPIFSVSGYADRRPIGGDRRTNLTPEGRAANRRIDLRFLMGNPRRPSEVAADWDSVAQASVR